MYIARTNSTNTLLKELIAQGRWPADERFIRAGYQTSGRGQAGNGWESEADKNLLCSILLPPRKNLFELNVIASVAVHRLVEKLIGAPNVNQRSVCGGESGDTEHPNDRETVSPCARLTNAIKWPNDIYWQDKKVAGILVENAIIGNEVRYSIAGIGLNVNQTEWHSDAPNPVSLKQIRESCQPSAIGRQITDFDLDELMQRLMEEIDALLQADGEDLWNYYKAHLYRREGFWPFVEREVSLAPTMNADRAYSRQHSDVSFMARISDVLPTGEILLTDQQNQERKYHFKQIRYVL